MNSKLEYTYRDGSNYKQHGSVVFAGEITDAERVTIKAALDDENWFLAEQVGLPNLRERWDSHFDDDHIWHELDEIVTVDEEPTVTETVHEFAARFAGIEWDVEAGQKQLDQWIASTRAGK